MEVIIAIIIGIVALFLWAACKVSGEQSRIEEYYRMQKKLDKKKEEHDSNESTKKTESK